MNMNHFFCLIFALVLLQSKFCFSGAEVFVSVSEGEDCKLPCSGLKGVRVSVLEWTRFDQRRDLLLYRAGKVLHGYEHSDYTNRVQLLDPQLHRGDLSVVLKEVTLKDSGTYKCYAFYEDKQEISQFIRLTVTEREQDITDTELTAGHISGVVIGVLFTFVFGVALGFYIRKRFKDSQFSWSEKPKEPGLRSSSCSITALTEACEASPKQEVPPQSSPALSPSSPGHPWEDPPSTEASAPLEPLITLDESPTVPHPLDGDLPPQSSPALLPLPFSTHSLLSPPSQPFSLSRSSSDPLPPRKKPEACEGGLQKPSSASKVCELMEN